MPSGNGISRKKERSTIKGYKRAKKIKIEKGTLIIDHQILKYRGR